jgi:hypothetical protein
MLRDRLLGTWALVAMEGRRASGTVFHPWGTDVCGRLTYDGAGHAALQIAKGSRERFTSEDLESGTPEEIRRAWNGYHAWFGRFTVSADEQFVTHHIEASLFPNWAAVEQTRLIALGEEELVLRSMPLPYGGEAVEFQTRWVRFRATETPP